MSNKEGKLMTKQEIRQYLTTAKILGLLFLVVTAIIYWRTYLGLKNGETLEPLERLLASYATSQYVLWAMAITAAIILAVIISVGKFIDVYWNRRAVSTSLNETLAEIVRCSADNEAMRIRAEKIGVLVAAKTIAVNPQVLQYCSAAALAKLLTALLYPLREEISRWEKIAGRDDKNIYQQLAATLVSRWPAEVIAEFISVVSGEKAYLAAELENAVQLERLERQIQGIRRQQTILEEKRNNQELLDAVIDEGIRQCSSLINSPSALKSWLRRLHPAPGGLVEG